jgi:hypothetical protein
MLVFFCYVQSASASKIKTEFGLAYASGQLKNCTNGDWWSSCIEEIAWDSKSFIAPSLAGSYFLGKMDKNLNLFLRADVGIETELYSMKKPRLVSEASSGNWTHFSSYTSLSAGLNLWGFLFADAGMGVKYLNLSSDNEEVWGGDAYQAFFLMNISNHTGEAGYLAELSIQTSIFHMWNIQAALGYKLENMPVSFFAFFQEDGVDNVSPGMDLGVPEQWAKKWVHKFGVKSEYWF